MGVLDEKRNTDFRASFWMLFTERRNGLCTKCICRQSVSLYFDRVDADITYDRYQSGSKGLRGTGRSDRGG